MNINSTAAVIPITLFSGRLKLEFKCIVLSVGKVYLKASWCEPANGPGAVTEQDAPAGQGGRAGVGQLLLIYCMIIQKPLY